MNVYHSNGKLINPLKNYHDHDIRSTDGRTVPNPMYNGTKGNLGTPNKGYDEKFYDEYLFGVDETKGNKNNKYSNRNPNARRKK